MEPFTVYPAIDLRGWRDGRADASGSARVGPWILMRWGITLAERVSMGLTHVLFDLDNTLYPRTSGLLQEIGRRIQVWMCDRLEMTWDEAAAVRRDYFVRYGTTLNGLLAERTIDAADFLAFVHDVPVERYLSPNPALAAMLAGIPLRRVVYTNATAAYSWRVLERLGVAPLFERVIGIEEVGLRNKLHREAYEHVLSLLAVGGPQCVMVEDSARNLGPARALGMATVLVSADDGEATEADWVVSSVLEVGPVVRRLMGAGGR